MLARVQPSLASGRCARPAAHQLAPSPVSNRSDPAGKSCSSRSGEAPPSPTPPPIDRQTLPDVAIDAGLAISIATRPVDILALDRAPAGPTSKLRFPTDAEGAAMTAVGARAALILPLTCEDRPWGKIACFHRTARHVSGERRTIARLFTKILSLRIEIATLRRGV